MATKRVHINATPTQHDYGVTVDSMFTWVRSGDVVTWQGLGLVDSFIVRFDKGDPCPFDWSGGQSTSNQSQVTGTVVVSGQARQVFAYSLDVRVGPNGHFPGADVIVDPEVVVDDNGPPPVGGKARAALAKSGLRKQIATKAKARRGSRRKPPGSTR